RFACEKEGEAARQSASRQCGPRADQLSFSICSTIVLVAESQLRTKRFKPRRDFTTATCFNTYPKTCATTAAEGHRNGLTGQCHYQGQAGLSTGRENDECFRPGQSTNYDL